MSYLLIVTSIFSAANAENAAAAEKLFQKVRGRITGAKSLKVVSKAKIDAAQKGTMEGTILFASRNRVRAKFKMTSRGRTRVIKAVSNGKQLALAQGALSKTKPAPEKYAETLRTAIAKASSVLLLSAVRGRPTGDKDFQVCTASSATHGRERRIRSSRRSRSP